MNKTRRITATALATAALVAPSALSASAVAAPDKPTKPTKPAKTVKGQTKQLLKDIAGIHARHLWDEGMQASDAATLAGVKALADAGIDPDKVGLLVNTSVSRDYLEPSTASIVSGVVWSMSPCISHSNPSRTPTTSIPSSAARIVAAPMTALMPGAGPPPTRMASFL